MQGTSGFPNEIQKSILLRFNADGQILNQIRTDKFQMLLYSPSKYYIKVQNVDTAHVAFTKIEADRLFN